MSMEIYLIKINTYNVLHCFEFLVDYTETCKCNSAFDSPLLVQGFLTINVGDINNMCASLLRFNNDSCHNISKKSCFLE